MKIGADGSLPRITSVVKEANLVQIVKVPDDEVNKCDILFKLCWLDDEENKSEISDESDEVWSDDDVPNIQERFFKNREDTDTDLNKIVTEDKSQFIPSDKKENNRSNRHKRNYNSDRNDNIFGALNKSIPGTSHIEENNYNFNSRKRFSANYGGNYNQLVSDNLNPWIRPPVILNPGPNFQSYVTEAQTQAYVPPQTQAYVPPQTQAYVPPQTQAYVPPQTQTYMQPQPQSFVHPHAPYPDPHLQPPSNSVMNSSRTSVGLLGYAPLLYTPQADFPPNQNDDYLHKNYNYENNYYDYHADNYHADNFQRADHSYHPRHSHSNRKNFRQRNKPWKKKNGPKLNWTASSSKNVRRQGNGSFDYRN